MRAPYPTDTETFVALGRIADCLGQWVVYLVGSSYHFTLPGGRSLAITPESARRLRVALWCGSEVRCTLWARVDDLPRLEGLVNDLAVRVRELV